MALALPLLASCEKELDFHYHDVASRLVVEGHTSQRGTIVALTHTCPMGESMNVTPLVDATVVLSDLTDGISRPLAVGIDGKYVDDLPGVTGHDYRIEILHGGRHHSAQSEMTAASNILGLEFKWIKMPYDYVAVLKIAFKDLPSVDTCFWIKIYRNGTPYKWILSDDRASVEGVINEVTMTTRQNPDDDNDDDILVDGDVLKVVVNPISRAMYDYLTAIQSDSNGPRMFEGDFCLGYYMASPESASSIVFNPKDITEY